MSFALCALHLITKFLLLIFSFQSEYVCSHTTIAVFFIFTNKSLVRIMEEKIGNSSLILPKENIPILI